MTYGESITLCRVYKKTSKTGNVYFTGRLGAAKIAILKSRDVADDGGEIWNIVVSEGPDKRVDHGNGKPNSYAQQSGINTEPQEPLTDTEIPF